MAVCSEIILSQRTSAVYTKKNSPVEYPYSVNVGTKNNRRYMTLESGQIDADFYRTMDYLATRLRNKYDRLPVKFFTLEETKDVIESIQNKKYEIEVKDRMWSFSKTYSLAIGLEFQNGEDEVHIGSSREIHDLLDEASKVKFKLEYTTSYLKGNNVYENGELVKANPGSHFEPFYYSNKDPQSLFIHTTTKLKGHGNYLYRVMFHTPLGYFFAMNCLRKDNRYIQFIPSKFYGMSNLAQLTYRLLIMFNPSGVFDRELFCRKIGYSFKSEKTHTKRVICKAMDELKKNGFVSEYSYDLEVCSFKILI